MYSHNSLQPNIQRPNQDYRDIFEKKIDPDTHIGTYLNKGHIMECLQGPKLRFPILFYGPGECAVKTDIKYSKLIHLDEINGVDYTYGEILGALRGTHVTKHDFVELRRQYLKKTLERLVTLKILSPPDRFRYLEYRQPWVFDIVDKKDIASYLNFPKITAELLFKYWW